MNHLFKTLWRCFAVLSVYVLAVMPTQASPLDYPPQETTFLCTSPQLSQSPSVYNWCWNKVIPDVCEYWKANGDFTTPAYPTFMALWNDFCASQLYSQTDKLIPPPPR